MTNEDTHFYVDNAPPGEVAWVLRSLVRHEALGTKDIARLLYTEYGFTMQKDKTYTPRRLYDLGLAQRTLDGGKVGYVLTELGEKVRDIAATDPAIYPDLMHFLHYARFDGKPETRKYLWSYRRCCEIVWCEKRLISNQEMASRVQALMRAEFPALDFGAAKGARFDKTGAGRCYAWIKHLSPSPFPENDRALRLRIVRQHELPLLALSYVYSARSYRYGDPIVLANDLLDAIAQVFFLDPCCCRELIGIAAKMTKAVTLADTFAGTSVNLLVPYGIESI